VGWLERRKRKLGEDLLDSDNNSECRDPAAHDRMPVILDPDSYDLWLDPGMQNVAAIAELLKPYDARVVRCYPVSTRVNHVANDDADCSRPVEVVGTQDRLFL
jgi:putative SOS response-associated peptidase YedK